MMLPSADFWQSAWFPSLLQNGHACSGETDMHLCQFHGSNRDQPFECAEFDIYNIAILHACLIDVCHFRPGGRPLRFPELAKMPVRCNGRKKTIEYISKSLIKS